MYKKEDGPTDQVEKSQIQEHERRNIRRRLREINGCRNQVGKRRRITNKAGNMESSINVVQMNNNEEVDQSSDREIEQRDDQGSDEEVDQREIEKNRNGKDNQRSGNSQLQGHVVGNQAVIINQHGCTAVHVPVPVVCYVPLCSAPSKNCRFRISIIEGNNETTKFYTGLGSWKFFQSIPLGIFDE